MSQSNTEKPIAYEVAEGIIDVVWKDYRASLIIGGTMGLGLVTGVFVGGGHRPDLLHSGLGAIGGGVAGLALRTVAGIGIEAVKPIVQKMNDRRNLE